MRYAVFSDIHGNLEAYKAALDDMSGRRIGRYLCAGDIVGYGADPALCIAETKDISDGVIAGNHDLASAGLFDKKYFNEWALEAVNWTAGVINEHNKDYLRQLALTYADGAIEMVHGTLNEPGEFHYITEDGNMALTFSLMRARICFVGHTHVPAVFCRSADRIRRAADGMRIEAGAEYIVDAGSIGQPRDGDPRGSYAIYDDELPAVEIRRFEYDIKAAQAKIIKEGLPVFLAERLAAGR